MIREVSAIINGRKEVFSSDTSYLDLAKIYSKDYKYPIIAVKEDNLFTSFNNRIKEGANIKFYDYSDREANKIYLNGLVFLTIYSIVKLVGPKARINVEHSLDKGLYLTVNFDLNEKLVNDIKDKMKEVVSLNLPIKKNYVKRVDAIEYFRKQKLTSKIPLLKYNTNTYITLYSLGNMYDFYFSNMPPTTGVFKAFDITKIGDRGLILNFPSYSDPEVIPKYQHRPGMFRLFNEQKALGKAINIYDIEDLNKLVIDGKVGDLIRLEETLHSDKLLNVCSSICQNKDRIKVILLAGPSSSGKTTSSIRLSKYFSSFGLKMVKLSMDDYFVDRKDTPLDEFGNKDYDSVYSLKIDLFNEQVEKILNGEEVVTPLYNFKTGTSEMAHKIKLHKDDILIIEGIHALNPIFLPNIPRENKAKIYVSPATDLNIDNHNRISTTDNRLLRRMVRDARTRNYKAEDTISFWEVVRRGEEKYVFPYQDEADYNINTAFLYELGVLKVYALPLLYSVPMSSPCYEDAKRLINLLKIFLPISSEDVPKDSLLREFIGGSCYDVS